jgi:signal transduction histidine kinase
MGLEESFKIKPPEIKPEKITSPIQLLAVWLSGLILIDGSFLIAATSIKSPSWIPALLVISAIVFVPLFLVLIFIMQTKFRPELQEDAFYSKYLDKERENNLSVNESASIRVDLEDKFRSIEGHIMVLEAEMKKDPHQEKEGKVLDQIQQVQKEYSRVLVEISHSVKSYLHSIMAKTNRLEYEVKKHEHPSKKLLNRITTDMYSDINGMSRLFDTIRFQSPMLSDIGTLSKTKLVGELLTPIIAELSLAAKQNKVKILLNDQNLNSKITGDIPAIQTAIYNIIENAVKYSKSDSAIKVDSLIIDGKYIIRVENEGVGIKAEDAKHLFDRGFRGRDAMRASTPGMGMGLFATNQIAKIHGGSVELKSPDASTTVVEFSLPIRQEDSNE